LKDGTSFSTWSDLQEYVDDMGSSHMETGVLMSIAQKYYAKFDQNPELMKEMFEKLTQARQPHGTKADILVGNVFTFKGDEFDNVLVASDFEFDALITDLRESDHCASSRPLAESINLVYVAVTRAKKKLYLSPAAMAYYNRLRQRAGLAPHGVHEEPAPKPNYANVRGLHQALSVEDAERERAIYGERWVAFTDTFGGKQALITRVEQVPWPSGPKGNVFAIHPECGVEAATKLARNEVKRYHSDKFFAIYAADPDVKDLLKDRLRVYMTLAQELRAQFKNAYGSDPESAEQL
jgi:hypothetical protein